MSLQCRLGLAAVLFLSTGLRVATAQSAMIRSAPPGASIELTLNGSASVTAKADGYGDVTVVVPPLGRDTDVQLHVDICGNVVKLLINEPGQPPAGADAGCTRKDMWGVYIMRPVTTFVVEVNGTDAAVYVAQGPPPRSWLMRNSDGSAKTVSWGTPGKGLTVSAGLGISSFSDAVANACGSVPSCQTSGWIGGLHFGADFWILPYVAAQIGYFRPGDLSATGTGDTFTFETERKMRVLTVGGKAGVPIGPGRIYGTGGWNRHEATENTTETVADQTITVDGVSHVVPGGTQKFGQKTEGWDWMVGGGFELWVKQYVGFYGDVTVMKLKGIATSGTGSINEKGTFIMAGARIRLWK